MGEAISAGELTKEANKAYHQEDFLAAAKAYQAADRKSTRLNSSHSQQSRMPSSA